MTDTHTFITNPNQFAPPAAPRRIPVGDIPGLHAQGGGYARVFAQELLWWENEEHQAALRDADGNVTVKSSRNSTIKFLSAAIRDQHGNRIWQSPDEAVQQLRTYPLSVINALSAKAIEVNSVDPKAVDRAEGNSATTPVGSSSGTSAPSPTSDTPLLVP